jgi:hypothetical protein
VRKVKTQALGRYVAALLLDMVTENPAESLMEQVSRGMKLG